MTVRWPVREYRILASFRAPLDFVFAWCTDISPIDPQLRKRAFVRKVIAKSPSRVVYEDLEEGDDGWAWDRNVVTTQPPNRWRLDAVGNHFDTRATYRLSRLPGGRTSLELRFQLRPVGRTDRLPAKSPTERDVARMWRLYGARMESDYRSGRPARSVAPSSRMTAGPGSRSTSRRPR